MNERPDDAHFQAFVNPKSPDVFRAVLSTTDVWRPDPVDVPSIHADARAAFEALVERVASGRPLDESERLWLVRGEPGAGKTHLISAFRTWLHENGKGFLAYLQMQTGITDYGRYILYSVVDSLEKAMSERKNPNSSLDVVSRAIFTEALVRSDDDDATFEPRKVAELLARKHNLFAKSENVVTALLTLQLHDPVLSQRAIRYLRGDELSAYELESIGNLAKAGEPKRIIEALADIVWTSFGVPLVICLDQLDDFYGPNIEESGGRFNLAIKTVRALLQNERVVVIVSILDEQYGELRRFLLQPELDRLEGGMKPIVLGAVPNRDALHDLIAMRLAYLYEMNELTPLADHPLYPFSGDVTAELEGMRYRTALRALRDAQLQSLRSGTPPAIGRSEPSAAIPDKQLELSQQWNDFRLTFAQDPGNARERLSALAFAVDEIAATTPQAAGARLAVELETGTLTRTVDGRPHQEVVAIVDQTPHGGSLLRAVESLAQRAVGRETTAVALRSSDFPTNPKLKTTKQLGDFLKAGNRRITFAAGEWRAILAYRAFREAHGNLPGFAAWLREEHPLVAQSGLQSLLELDVPSTLEMSSSPPSNVVQLAFPEPPAADVELAATDVTAPGISLSKTDATATLPSADEPILIGHTEHGETVALAPQTLNRHLAILGGAGSGKTTLAFTIIEGLLLRGVPVILIDRKGDLASYASDDAWQRSKAEPARRDALRERLDIQLFTPGNAAGRNLRIATVPEGLAEMSVNDRQEASRLAADGLRSMLEWGATKRAQLAALTQAIEIYGEVVAAPSLGGLIDFIADEDARLLGTMGRLDRKILKSVAADLSSLSINAKKLMPTDAEPLDIDMLFGRGPHARPGKTRLSIVYVGGLGDGNDMLFWVSRFLAEFYRYARRSPRTELQGLAFFDEADRYLPATSSPVTKEPMESAIKRVRSAGLGIALATQSPGDLDYKSKENVTTWLTGRVSQPQALQKLRAVFSNDGLIEKLPTFTVGQFALKTDDRLQRFRATLPIIIPQQIEETEIVRLAGRAR